ncbi:nucleoside recognition protein [Paenibacillus sp. JX-17]|uniref:Nucleoside recognition protein n=1 Tax=Paenibacillus lacisoli TaxID=3064525 RepID=A0ABT9C9H3_9BACL|nr:nucleoside recognition domain-containing protein [Paenibacillus sp. JX-17]MDO7905881.1 nucleoside recognition protein [Paenibacillus sp. JX-17]
MQAYKMSPVRRQQAMTLLLGAGSLLLVAAIVASPDDVFQASLQGLTIWWKIVFPAMLPFLMLSEMLLAFGAVHALGHLLQPVMQRWFRLPGASAWVLVLGMSSGFPAGARAARQLEERGELTSRQSSILGTASHFCNPLSILIVIGTGFIGKPEIGYILIAVHVLSGLLSAWIMARWVLHKPVTAAASASTVIPQPGWLEAMHSARLGDGRSFGRLLGETVKNAVQSLLMTGGYMILFSVVILILMKYITPGAPAVLWPAIMEVHIGSYAFSQTDGTMLWQAAWISAILGAGGLCGWFQAVSMLKPADGGAVFGIGRLLHGGLAFAMLWLLWPPVQRWAASAEPALAFLTGSGTSGSMPVHPFTLWGQWEILLLPAGLMATCLSVLALASWLTRLLSRAASR